MKKKHILLSAVLGIGLSLTSCSDYLVVDKYFRDRFTIEEVFKNKDYTEEWLADTYNHLLGANADVCSKGNSPFCFADDMYFGDRNDLYKKLKMGEYKEGEFQDSWKSCYEGIRKASIFIANVHMNEELKSEEILDYKAQARFVRAYYYWLLLRKYGPIPLLPEEGLDYTESYDNLSRPRNTYDECANYIADELKLAAKDLQEERGSLNINRPTQGAALAARAKVLLFAASPINNPRPSDTEKFPDLVDDQGKLLLSQEYDESKWARAAAAARDVMELKGKYNGHRYELYHVSASDTEKEPGFPKTVKPFDDNNFSEKNWPEGYKDIDPFLSYRGVFNGEATASDNNPELIFSRGQNMGVENLKAMVGHQLPRTFGGWNTHGITQKQCDAYYMNNGKDCPGKDREIGRGDGSRRRVGYTTKEDFKNGLYPELGVTYKDKVDAKEHLGVGVSLQYVEREPRFYASVAFNGSTWYAQWKQDANSVIGPKKIFYYRGDGDGYANNAFWLRTGIGVMKFVHPKDNNDNKTQDSGWTHIQNKSEPAIRFAEVLLIYAEAVNELTSTHQIPSWDGKTTYSLIRSAEELKKGIQPVRIRAGIPDYEQDTYGNADLFRAKLKRERQIELMGEGHRYYDLRRWKDAEVEESLPIYGCNALMTENERDLFHTPMKVASLTTAFSRKMYFWPISHDELKKNKRLTQNPGWTYNN